MNALPDVRRNEDGGYSYMCSRTGLGSVTVDYEYRWTVMQDNFFEIKGRIEFHAVTQRVRLSVCPLSLSTSPGMSSSWSKSSRQLSMTLTAFIRSSSEMTNGGAKRMILT